MLFMVVREFFAESVASQHGGNLTQSFSILDLRLIVFSQLPLLPQALDDVLDRVQLCVAVANGCHNIRKRYNQWVAGLYALRNCSLHRSQIELFILQIEESALR